MSYIVIKRAKNNDWVFICESAHSDTQVQLTLHDGGRKIAPDRIGCASGAKPWITVDDPGEPIIISTEDGIFNIELEESVRAAFEKYIAGLDDGGLKQVIIDIETTPKPSVRVGGGRRRKTYKKRK